MPDRRFIIYCDESTAKGKFYSNFYGGALIAAEDRQRIEDALSTRKLDLHLGAELKWTKITESYKDKYIAFIDTFFDFIESSNIKIRIMFTHNINSPVGLDDEQMDNEYWLLYYQLVKHAFGLIYCGNEDGDTTVSLYLDDVPDKQERFDRFRRYVASLSLNPNFIAQRVSIPLEEITDVDSRGHLIMQGLDIILGSMQFRLNDLHRVVPDGKKRRSKRTRAKEQVYQHINRRIRKIYPNFNIGMSTSSGNDPSNRWTHPYRHWLFVPAETEFNWSASKKKGKTPPTPT